MVYILFHISQIFAVTSQLSQAIHCLKHISLHISIIFPVSHSIIRVSRHHCLSQGKRQSFRSSSGSVFQLRIRHSLRSSPPITGSSFLSDQHCYISLYYRTRSLLTYDSVLCHCRRRCAQSTQYTNSSYYLPCYVHSSNIKRCYILKSKSMDYVQANYVPPHLLPENAPVVPT